ncbi:hypothetical protein C0Q70_17465 [Pomacea canaliculata]|uniref:Uncharacterized protein n=1 Tax=Pomacea canaliculata TaxID=400727 RepID=A0A2T7NKI1_POMCA|nr:uncharacterized protein LOC112575351 [Pomacea canaliculata]PVD21666.1 hypothetical protein C0Q70_17465 [Pomacea canaliculata]
MTNLSVAILLLLLVQTATVQGSCYGAYSNIDEETGSTYCMAEDSVRLEVGEWYLTSSCFNCSCSETAMSCCGVGIHAGAMATPPGYKVELIPPCGYRFVKDTK